MTTYYYKQYQYDILIKKNVAFALLAFSFFHLPLNLIII